MFQLKIDGNLTRIAIQDHGNRIPKTVAEVNWI